MLVNPQSATLLWENSQADNYLPAHLAGSIHLASGSQFSNPLLVDPQAAALLWEHKSELQDQDDASKFHLLPGSCQATQPLSNHQADSINPLSAADFSHDDDHLVDPQDAALLWSNLDDGDSDTDMNVDR